MKECGEGVRQSPRAAACCTNRRLFASVSLFLVHISLHVCLQAEAATRKKYSASVPRDGSLLPF